MKFTIIDGIKYITDADDGIIEPTQEERESDKKQ